MEVLAHIGEHPVQTVREIVSDLPNHPLYDVELGIENYGKHLELLQHTLGRKAESVLARLTAIHEGRRPFRQDVVEKLIEELKGRVVETLLNWIEEACDAETLRLSKSFGSSLDVHTIHLLGEVTCNKRVFRRMLRSYASEGGTAIRAHQKNQECMVSHRQLVQRGWFTPHVVEVQTEKTGRFVMRVEQQFEEVLKMGTRVGSCPAIGGCNSHSAVANAADANKQVVVAHDAEGRFMARQLIAISEEGRLVCFDLYRARGEEEELERAFSAYDRYLAKALGIPLETEDDGYTIKPLVCPEWYDDYAWNPLRIEEPARILRIERPRRPAELTF